MKISPKPHDFRDSPRKAEKRAGRRGKFAEKTKKSLRKACDAGTDGTAGLSNM
jgi:hypothetical protein